MDLEQRLRGSQQGAASRATARGEGPVAKGATERSSGRVTERHDGDLDDVEVVALEPRRREARAKRADKGGWRRDGNELWRRPHAVERELAAYAVRSRIIDAEPDGPAVSPKDERRRVQRQIEVPMSLDLQPHRRHGRIGTNTRTKELVAMRSASTSSSPSARAP